jgi:hypothetical protein
MATYAKQLSGTVETEAEVARTTSAREYLMDSLERAAREVDEWPDQKRSYDFLPLGYNSDEDSSVADYASRPRPDSR